MRSHVAKTSRSGLSFLVVLICLVVVTGLVGSSLRNMLLVQRQSRQQVYWLQASGLADSALERAVFLLQQNDQYHGETWSVKDPVLGAWPGHVDIHIETDLTSEITTIRTTATFPQGAELAVTVRREIKVDTVVLTAPEPSEEGP